MLRMPFSVSPLLLLVVLSVNSSLAVAGICIPPPHILSPNAGDRLVADVVVIGKVPSLNEGHFDSAIMRASAVYAGAAPRRIVVESGPPAVNSIDCPINLGGYPVGTRLLMNIRQDPVTGRFGAGFSDRVAVVEGGSVSGLLVYPDCPSGDSNCFYARQTMDVSEFLAMAESYHPGQFSAKTTISLGTLNIGLRDGKPVSGSEIALAFETSPLCSRLVPNAVRTGAEGGVLEISLRLVGFPLDITPEPPCDIGWPEVIPIGRVYERGSHVVKIYAESAEGSEGFFQQDSLVGELPFEVAEASELANPETPSAGSIQSGIGLSSPFVTGLSGDYDLENFPEAGQSTTVRWSQPDQNFIIIGRTD